MVEEYLAAVGSRDFIYGFMTPIAAGAAFLIINWFVVKYRQIRQYFQATVEPGRMPTRDGPSPFNRLVGCGGNFVKLVGGLALLGVLIWYLSGR